MALPQGAEATLTREDDRLIKTRIPKGYRHDAIDERLRIERTEQEARLLRRAKQAGVNVPDVLEEDETEIVMEFIDGRMLKDCFVDRDDLWERFGQDIARLHDRDIIHGDLTTSNVLVQNDELVFIDFGLGFFSQRVEDRATDLRLLEQVIHATHHTVAESAFDQIMNGYKEFYVDAEAVMERLDDIRGRGRYTE